MPGKKGMKRGVSYSIKIAEFICDKFVDDTHVNIDTGQTNIATLDGICKKYKDVVQVDTKTVHRWISKHPEFEEMYFKARRIQSDLLSDIMHEMTQKLREKPPEDYKQLRTLLELNRQTIDVIKFHLAKVAPALYKAYSDKQEVANNSTVVNIINYGDAVNKDEALNLSAEIRNVKALNNNS